MKSSPQPPTLNNPRGHLTEFTNLIQAKSQNFVGREFVFTAINEFIRQYHRGYFTIIGVPGIGKSAILFKYVLDNPQVIYYNAELEGKNQAGEFLRYICTQLINRIPTQVSPELPDNVTEGSWFFSLLLQQISNQLAPQEKLIIAIDGLNFVNPNLQPPGTNLFYLPRYLPEGVYFLLTRRPFVREKSGLLIETPTASLDLANYLPENHQDILTFLQQELPQLKFWLNSWQINGEDFGTGLSTIGENNFMYLSQIISAISNGFYSHLSELLTTLPPGLTAYYQQHWQKMLPTTEGRDLNLAVLNVLVQQQPITVAAISEIIDVDEYEIEEVLETWREFLQQQHIAGEVNYSLYHSSFRHWCSQQLQV